MKRALGLVVAVALCLAAGLVLGGCFGRATQPRLDAIPDEAAPATGRVGVVSQDALFVSPYLDETPYVCAVVSPPGGPKRIFVCQAFEEFLRSQRRLGMASEVRL